MKAVVLALGGGGVRGVAHIGVIRFLDKIGVHIQAIAGTSAGSLIGALYAAGYNSDDMEKIVNEIRHVKDLYSRTSQDKLSLLGTQGFIHKLVDVLGERTFEDLKIPMACTAVDLHTSREVVITDGIVMDAVLASCAVPGIFPPREDRNMLLVDGATLDPVPVSVARQLKPGLPVIAVCLSPDPYQYKQTLKINLPPIAQIPQPIIDRFSQLRIARAFQIFIQASEISSMATADVKLQVDKPEILIRPDVSMYGMLDLIDPEILIAAGEEAARNSADNISSIFSLSRRITGWKRKR